MTLDELVARVEDRRKTITLYAPDERRHVGDLFATRNVTVEHVRIPEGGPGGFAVIRDDEGFVGAIGLDELETLLEPPISRPWDAGLGGPEYGALFDALDDTLFSSFDRRQLLAAAREIERRAWRAGAGVLRVGFQRHSAFRDQVPIYERLGADTDLDVHVYGRRDWDPPAVPGVSVHSETSDEIGSYWFLAFDGGDDRENACALLAEERSPGRFFGFWTFDRELVDELLAHLRRTY